MFDDVKKEDQNIPPTSLNTAASANTPPKENNPILDDMFQEVDPALNKTTDNFINKPSAVSSGKLQMASPSSTFVTNIQDQVNNTNRQLLMGEEDSKGSNVKKALVAFVGIVLVALVAWGAYAVFFAQKSSDTNKTNINTNNNINNNTNTVNSTENNSDNTTDILTNDDDKDGLSNAQEDALHTDPNNPDSDDDGLFDKDEVRVYLTDPMNPDTDNDGLFDNEEISVWKTKPLEPDTDGDSYLDGIEVANGYNPLGDGPLLTNPRDSIITQ